MKIVNQALLDSFSRKWRCEWCGKKGPVEPHHIFSRGMGGTQRVDIAINLIALCVEDHRAFHDGKIMRADLLALVAAREGRLQDEIETEIRRLRRL